MPLIPIVLLVLRHLVDLVILGQPQLGGFRPALVQRGPGAAEVPRELGRGVGAAVRGEALLHGGLDPSTEPSCTVVPRGVGVTGSSQIHTASDAKIWEKAGAMLGTPFNQAFESDDRRLSSDMRR